MTEQWKTWAKSIKDSPYFRKAVWSILPLGIAAPLACTPAQPTNTLPQPEHLPSSTPRPTEYLPTPTPTRIEPSPVPFSPATSIPTGGEQTPTILQSVQDSINRDLTVEGKAGEILVLKDVLIGHIFRTPWENREAYVAVIDTINEKGAVQMIGIGLSTDCVFDMLRERRDLGNPILPGLGAWTPKKRVDQLTAEVLLSSSANPTILNVKRLVDRGVEKNCVEVTALQRLKEQISRIRWNEMPRDIGRLAGWIAAEFIRGIRGGIASGAPTPTSTPHPGIFPDFPRIPNPFR